MCFYFYFYFLIFLMHRETRLFQRPTSLEWLAPQGWWRRGYLISTRLKIESVQIGPARRLMRASGLFQFALRGWFCHTPAVWLKQLDRRWTGDDTFRSWVTTHIAYLHPLCAFSSTIQLPRTQGTHRQFSLFPLCC